MDYKFIDLFAGIGGFRIGFTRCGYKCVMSCEINKYCQESYLENYGEWPQGDIANIDPYLIPDHDVLTAGFPCQPFSICGRRDGFNDTRGTMFFYICKIIAKKKPKIVLLENVKYLLYHNKGQTFKVILESLENLGYHVAFSLQNAVNYGVPQNRERVIIIGTRKHRFNFSKLKTSHHIKPLLYFLEEENNRMKYLEKKDYTLIKKPIKQTKSHLYFVGYRNKTIRKKGVRPNTIHLSRVHKQPNRIYSVYGVHPTIPSQEISGRFFICLPDKDRVRKLTLRECYRIMGFPDSFKIHKSNTEAYKQIGNSVCVPMVYELARQIKLQILDKYNEKATVARQNTSKVLSREKQLTLQ